MNTLHDLTSNIRAFWPSLFLFVVAWLVLAGSAHWICPQGECRITAFDKNGLSTLHHLKTPWLDFLFSTATHLGSLSVLLPLALWLSWRPTTNISHQVLFIPVILIMSTVMAHVTKFIYARPRPALFESGIPMPEDLSFPSAHTMQIMAFGCAYLLRPWGQINTVEVITIFSLVSVVAISRIYLQVHFPTDVVMGLMAALLLALSIYFLPVWTHEK
jgi:membrane-associated phospholipid phosphatase